MHDRSNLSSGNLTGTSGLTTSSVGPFAAYALLLFRAGYMPIPIVPGEKRPALGKGWEKHRRKTIADQRKDMVPMKGDEFLVGEGEIALWVNQYPNAGLGVMCGDGLHELVTVDIDEETAAGLVHSIVPGSLVAKRGRRGHTLFYRNGGGVVNENFRRGTEMLVEILTGGRQTVLPPTIHPDTGQPYYNLQGFAPLHDVPIGSLPLLTVEHVDALRAALITHGFMEAPKPPKVGEPEDLEHLNANRDRYAGFARRKLEMQTGLLAHPREHGRRQGANNTALALGPYVAHGLISEEEIWQGIDWASQENGKYTERDGNGRRAVRQAFEKGLSDGMKKPLPKLTDDHPHAQRQAARAGAPLHGMPPAPQGTPVAGVTGAEGFDPSVRHYAGALPDAQPVERPQTRQEFVNLITATDSNVDGGFEALTEEIPAMMAAAAWLTEAACDQLFKLIANKTSAKPATIKRAYDKAKSDNEDLDPIESQQLIIAKKVIADCYENGLNIITSEYGVRAWNGGYWEKLHEQTVRKQIHGAALVLAAGAQISDSAVKSIYALIKTETFKSIKFDEPAHFINVANGEIHLVAGVWIMFPALREHYRTSQLPVAFDPAAVCPVFDALLTSLFESDPDCEEKANCLLEMMGYTLTTLTSYEKFIILVGNGANGKSMVFNIMKSLLGPKAIAAIQPAQFGDTFKTSHLEGKLANMVTEIKKNATLKDDIMKALTSGETVTAEKKFMDPFDFNNHATMWLGCNELPKMDDFTQGMFRRTIIIPMNEIFGIKGKPLSATSTRVATQDADPDLKLIERGEGPLAAELPGILNMALAALAGLIERKGVFTEANSSRARLRQWRDDNDNVAAFIADKCVTGLQCRCGSSELYRHYDTYARGRGEPAVTQTAFVRYLKTNTEVSVARTSSHNDLAGIGLKISDAILPTYTPAPAPHIPKISGEWPTATKH